jgi:hypothetical protein
MQQKYPGPDFQVTNVTADLTAVTFALELQKKAQQ